MLFDSNKITELLIKYKITPNQFFIIHNVYKKELNDLRKYIDSRGKFNDTEIYDLVDKGILEGEPIRKAKKIEFLDLFLTEEFEKEVFIDLDDAWDELFRAYPKFTIINGKSVILTKGGQTDKGYVGLENMKTIYHEKIGGDVKTHKEVIKAVGIGKKMKAINFTLRDFIVNELWHTFLDVDDDVVENSDYSGTQLI